MKVRVTRILNYTYESLEDACDDVDRWAVQGTRKFGKTTIMSRSLPPDYDEEET